MDTGIKDVAYLWRELNDKWYRIQTNSKYLIDRLKRRMKVHKTITLCGKTLTGSSQYWMVFRLPYNKPYSARRSFLRLTNCGNKYKTVKGVMRAEVFPRRTLKSDIDINIYELPNPDPKKGDFNAISYDHWLTHNGYKDSKAKQKEFNLLDDE